MFHPILASTEPMHPIGVALCVGGGVFALIASIRNWNWFFMYPPAPIFVALLSRTGARVFYIVLGSALAVVGGLAGLGIVK